MKTGTKLCNNSNKNFKKNKYQKLIKLREVVSPRQYNHVEQITPPFPPFCLLNYLISIFCTD